MTSPHDHGSLGEEAARLAEAVQDWLRGAARGGEAADAADAADAWADATAPPRTPSPECLVCPVCQLLRLVRSARPEVFEHLSDAAASLTAALRELVAEPPPRGPRDGGVEHIDLG